MCFGDVIIFIIMLCLCKFTESNGTFLYPPESPYKVIEIAYSLVPIKLVYFVRKSSNV